MLHFHVASNRTNSDGLAVHFGLMPTSTSSCTVKKEKLNLCCCITARAKPMGRQCQTARMKLMFVRWFGRPLWTHADVHLLAQTHCSLEVSAVLLDSHRRPSPRIHSLFVRWFGRPFWTHADVRPQIPGIHSKENSTCTAASQHEPANQWVDSIRLPE